MAFSFNQIWQVVNERDLATKILYGYEWRLKRVLTVIVACFSVSYIVCIMFSLYLIELRRKDMEGKNLSTLRVCIDIEDILSFMILMSILYCVMQMEASGTWILDIIFEQLNFELIIDSSP